VNWGAVGAVGEIIGAVAVLVTLIYLAVQIRQTRIAQQIDAIRTNRTERRDFFTALRDSPYIPPIIAKLNADTQISNEEELRLIAHYAALWGLIYSEWVQANLAIAGKFKTSQSVNVAWAIAQPRSLDWFNRYGRRLYPEEFILDIEAEISRLADAEPG